MSSAFDTDSFDEIFRAFEIAADALDPPNTSKFTPLPHFMTPDQKFYLWMLFGGRGSGKTAHAARYVHDHVHGPPCLPDVPGGHWISIVGPTLGDAVTSCVEGPSGLRAHDPGIKTLNRPGGLIARWSNGCEAKLFGAQSPEDVERFRAGGNRCLVWCEEFAAWRYLKECWQQIRYGLRSGPWPHAIASTTPRPKEVIREIVKASKVPGQTRYIVSSGTTNTNPHLNDEVRTELYNDYSGTRMGRQELNGELLEDVPGALWTGELIDLHRVKPDSFSDKYDRVIVGVDPAATEGGDKHGIVVVGVKYTWDEYTFTPFPHLPHGFVLADYSCHGSPHTWAKQVRKAFQDWDADIIVAEANNGGDMVVANIQSMDSSLPVKKVIATRGKTRRAEPIANLYEQGRMHHVGIFPELEDEMTTWDASDPEANDKSPDHMDAMVWAATEGMVGSGELRQSTPEDTRLKGRR